MRASCPSSCLFADAGPPVCVCVFMYIYSHVCMYVCMYIHVKICLFKCVCRYTYILTYTHTHAHARARAHTHTHTHTPHIQVLKCVGVCLSLQNAIRKAHNASRKGRLRRGSRIGTPVYVTSSYTYVTSPEKRFWSWKPTSHGPAKTCGRTCHIIIHTCHIITGLRRPPEVVRGMGPGGNRGKRCSLSPIPGSSAARRRRTVGPAAL